MKNYRTGTVKTCPICIEENGGKKWVSAWVTDICKKHWIEIQNENLRDAINNFWDKRDNENKPDNSRHAGTGNLD